MGENEREKSFEERMEGFLLKLKITLEWRDEGGLIVYFLTAENSSQAQTLVKKMRKIFDEQNLPTEEFDWTDEDFSEFLKKVILQNKKPTIFINLVKEKPASDCASLLLTLNLRESATMRNFSGVVIIERASDKGYAKSLTPDLFTVRELGF